MLKRKKITSKGERKRFAEIFEIASRGHKPVSLAYLKNAWVIVFYRPERPNEWVAGYVINFSAPFRYFAVLSDTKRESLLAQHNMRIDDISEVTCIWIDNTKVSKSERLNIYFCSMKDAFKAGKSYIFGGSTEPKVVALQKQIMPHDFDNGMALVGDEFTEYWIYYVGRWESVFTMVRFVMKQFVNGFFRKKAKPKVPAPPTESQKEELAA